MKRNLEQELQKEREKLSNLVDRALEYGMPLSNINKIIEQSRKIDQLINEKMMKQET